MSMWWWRQGFLSRIFNRHFWTRQTNMPLQVRHAADRVKCPKAKKFAWSSCFINRFGMNFFRKWKRLAFVPAETQLFLFRRKCLDSGVSWEANFVASQWILSWNLHLELQVPWSTPTRPTRATAASAPPFPRAAAGPRAASTAAGKTTSPQSIAVRVWPLELGRHRGELVNFYHNPLCFTKKTLQEMVSCLGLEKKWRVTRN